jgi:hypothetical protein
MLEGEGNPFICNGGSICRCMRGDETGGPGNTAAVGLWTCVPGLVGPLPDSGPEVTLSAGFDSPALPAISPCVCWGWEVGCGVTLANKGEHI